MKNKTGILSIYLICYCLSLPCYSQNVTNLTTNNKVYTINMDNITSQKSLLYSDIFKSAKVISLNEKDVVIGHINKMQVYKEQLFILDSSIAKGLFVFDKNGNFLHKIGNEGNGPGEYLSCPDFAINKQTEEILIYDTHPYRIYIYDLSSGKFKRHLNIKDKDKVKYIWINNGKLYGVDNYFTGKEKEPYYILKQIDTTTGEVLVKWMNADEYNKNWKDEFMHTPFFYSIDKDKDLFAFGLCDTIMCIEKDKLYPYIAFSGDQILKKSEIPKEMMSTSPDINIRYKKSDDFFMMMMKKNKFAYIAFIFEHNNNAYLKCSKVSSNYLLRYNKIKKEACIYDFVRDDVLYSKEPKSHVIPTFLTSDEKGVYYVVDIDFLPELKGFAQQEEVLSDLIINKNKLKEINEDSNPIILYYEYK